MDIDLTNPFRRFAPSVDAAPTKIQENTFRFVFSNERVGRDRFIVLNRGIQHVNYDRNPIALWCHDDKQPPVGRGSNIDTSRPDCSIDITFVDRGILPFAGTVRDLVAGKWLRAVSLSWLPIKWKRSDSPDVEAIFTEVDMLEVSVTPLPALPDALLAARSRGVDTRPLYDWASAALDTGGDLGTLGTLDRPLVEAICRASRPNASSATTGTEESRLRRARELQAEDWARQDRERYERYRNLRDFYGFTDAQAAWNLGMSEEEMRSSIARAIAQRNPGGNVASVVDFPARKFSANDRSKLRSASRYLAKAQRHHSMLEDHHDNMGERLRDAHAAHRALTSTLQDLGERPARITETLAGLGYDHHKITRAVKEMGAALDALRKVHGDAEDVAGQAQDCVRSACSSIDGMIGSGSDEGDDKVH